MSRRNINHLHLISVFMMLLVSGAAFVGCNTNGVSDAQAAERRKIETYTYQENTFVLITESAPTVAIGDGTTQYTINSDGDISFISSAGAASFDLNAGDIVVQNTPSSTVTLIRIT